ncbi:MAG: hypothetical protein K2Y29_13725 [Beijerinckiaceae bacterium]|nr:hypothetical protein [Beijerinckiaceae bacterium]
MVVGLNMIPRLQDGPTEAYAPRQAISALNAYIPASKIGFRMRDESEASLEELHPAANDYIDVVETIQSAARTIEELVKRNQTLRADSDAVILRANKELVLEREHSERLQKELEALRQKHASAHEAQERRIRTMNVEKQDLADLLQKTEEELDVARQWLEYLSSHVRSQLSAAAKKADQLFKPRVSPAG